VVGNFQQLFDSLNPNEQQRGFEFEHVCQWFLQNDPAYISRLKRVWLWKEWPGRWSDADSGIDLVAEDTDGKRWAVQAKAYGEDKPIPKRELNKFLSASSRKEFSYRLLISTTTNGLHHIAQENVAAQDKPVFIVDLLDLRRSPVDWPKSLTDLRPTPLREPAQPRPHQDDAILDVVGGFESHDRGQLIMACGTGKTLTAWFIRGKVSSQRTLVLVPSLSLLKQTMHEWECAAGGQVRFASMPVCSDASVSNTDDPGLIYTAELGVPTETDPAAIAKFLRGRGPRVVFSTYHSSPQIAKAFELGRVPAFDLVVADEAHRVAGRVSSDFATVLDASKIKAHKRLFMTATPKVYSAATKKAAKDENFEQASMDDHDTFGPVFHKLGFGDAIERNLLTDYRVAIIGVNDAMYHEWTQRGTFVTFDGTTPVTADKAAGQIGLAKAMREFDLQRTISFHSRVSRARKFAASMQPVIDWMPAEERPDGELWTGYASGEMDAGKRARLIRHLADLDDADRGLLTNARCLAEGVDVPTLDGVAFIDPRRSEVDIVQAVGRAIRKSDNKKLGTVVVPVFIKDTDDPEAALNDSAFEPVWDVLRALRSHDDELGRQLDCLRREMGSEGRTPELPPKIYTDIPKSIGAAFSNAFRIRLVEQTTMKWEFMFGLLEQYIDEHGDARVAQSYSTGEGHRLGTWVATQRNTYQSGRMDEERQRRLEALPGWAWNALRSRWEEGFAHAEQYVAEFGDARVPKGYTSPDGYRLGQWINGQRSERGFGGFSVERQARLEALPGWVWDARDAMWEDGFTHAERYVTEFGDIRVPRGYLSSDGFRLSTWLTKQRSTRGGAALTEDRRKRLEALPGWVWDVRDAMWEDGFTHTEQYVLEFGDARVPDDYTSPDGYRLGQWIGLQRAGKAGGKLSLKRQQRLEALPGWVWDVLDSQWDEGFTHMEQYVAEFGDARVPYDYKSPDGYRLGQWVTVQRSRQPGPSRRACLEALPGWMWRVPDSQWEEGFTHLEQHAAEFGTTRFPNHYMSPDGFRLGGWANKQRAVYTSGRMNPERRARLEAQPGWVWNVLDSRWEEGFGRLEQFVADFGSARVPRGYTPPDGFRLAQWVGVQRSMHGDGKLNPERQARLESLPGWSWKPHGDKWEDGLAHAEQYVAEFGDIRASNGYTSPDGFRLGGWLQTQRTANAKGRLSAGRKVRLEALPGWVWDLLDTQWEEGFARLENYAAEFGDSLVPQTYTSPDGFRLGGWGSKQRTAYRAGRMHLERAARLEALPGWTWEPPKGRRLKGDEP
jgi:superfamily II DNA or RNA helicase